MAKNYEESQRQVEKLAQILEAGNSLQAQSELSSLPNLVRTGLHSVLELVKTQNEQIAIHCVNQDRHLDESLEQKIRSTEKAVKEIGFECHQQNLRDKGMNLLNKQLISEFYDFENELNNQDTAKETEIRSIPSFNGEQSNTDVLMEQMFVQINQVGLQMKLSERGLKSVLFKKLSGTALQVIQAQMVLLNLNMTDISFTHLVSLCENAYMKNSSVRAAKLALHNLPRLSASSKKFMERQAEIVRLAQLSVKDITDDNEKKILFISTCMQYFFASLQPTDKAILDSHNTQRLSQGLDTLSIQACVQVLENHYRDKQGDSTQAASYLSSINRVYNEEENTEQSSNETFNDDHEQFGWEYEDQNVYWVQRGRSAGRQRSRGRPFFQSRGRSSGQPMRGPPGQSRLQEAPRPPHNAQPFRRGNRGTINNFQRGFQPRQSFQRGSGNQNAGNQYTRGYAPRQGLRGGRTDRKPRANDDGSIWERLNIAKPSCWQCGDPRHSINSDLCIYKQTPLFKSACGKCKAAGGGGGHGYQICRGPLQVAITALRQQNQQINQVYQNFEENQDNNGELDLDKFLQDLEN